MTSLTNWLLCSITVAALLGGSGWLARHWRRPALGHALYVLAFLKLLTPPIFAVVLWDTVVTSMPVPAATSTLAPTAAHALASTAVAPPVATSLTAATAFTWPHILIALWVIGSSIAAAIFARRLRRLDAWIRSLPTATRAVTEPVRECAKALGLTKSPTVHVTESRISPMIAATSAGVRLVLPTCLLAQLSPEALRTVYVHELAHIKRRDWLMRFVEMVAIAAFWWLPLVYLLRRGLRRTEELCCDAWVTQQLPRDKDSYSEALVMTANLHSPMPACGMGPVALLTERIDMLEQTSQRPRLTSKARASVAALAAVLLPIVACSSPQHIRVITMQHDRAVVVMGAVKESKNLQVGEDGHDTLLGAITSVQTTESADLTRTTLFRYGTNARGEVAIGDPLTICVDTREMLRTGVTTYNIQLEPGDIIYIPEDGEAAPHVERTAPPSRVILADKTTIEAGDFVSCVVDPQLLATPGCENLRLLTELQAIGASGTVFVPFVGSVKVVGMTTAEAGTKINDALATFVLLPTKVAVRAGRPVADPRD